MHDYWICYLALITTFIDRPIIDFSIEVSLTGSLYRLTKI